MGQVRADRPTMLAPLIGEMLGVDKTPITCSEDGRGHFSAEVSAAPSRLHSPRSVRSVRSS
jgi:hypothetical protein